MLCIYQHQHHRNSFQTIDFHSAKKTSPSFSISLHPLLCLFLNLFITSLIYVTYLPVDIYLPNQKCKIHKYQPGPCSFLLTVVFPEQRSVPGTLQVFKYFSFSKLTHQKPRKHLFQKHSFFQIKVSLLVTKNTEEVHIINARERIKC